MDVYRERAMLLAHLSTFHPSHLMVDAEGEAGFQTVVCIHTSEGQMGWHIADEDVDLFDHLWTRENHYDGHTTEDKYERLNRVTKKRGWKPDGRH